MDTEGLIDNIEDAWKIEYEDLVFEKEIGRGAFGAVYKGNYYGTEVAIKKILDLEDDPDAMIYLDREVNVLKGMRHPNIVQFIGICNDPEEGLHIVTEFVPSGDLRASLKGDKAMSWKLRIKLAHDVACAMAYIHSRNIIHRDLKSKNLLVDEGWKVKICDFGLARTAARNNHMTLCGTDDWMAPEVILGMQYNQKADVFSYGIVLCEIITRKKISLAFQRTPMEAFGMDVVKFKQLIPSDCPLEFAVVALECCAYEPEERPSFKELIGKLKKIMDEVKEVVVATPSPTPVRQMALPPKGTQGPPSGQSPAGVTRPPLPQPVFRTPQPKPAQPVLVRPGGSPSSGQRPPQPNLVARPPMQPRPAAQPNLVLPMQQQPAPRPVVQANVAPVSPPQQNFTTPNTEPSVLPSGAPISSRAGDRTTLKYGGVRLVKTGNRQW
eukprot:TRINITY_DN3869_c0_g1_i1.p1 TRINITY_DN3869_c0_g1~~TRINITY_DN3869_c0_g1_i1.p1  ORF type:complete len:438 (-),score=76.92 TRINITY_DN3869_c0_g1_i1:38-1351(-)